MGLREQKKEETRKLLLAKASELFKTKGYQHVTTAEIARAAGIAEGTLFNYYRNKGELFIAAAVPSSFEESEEPDWILDEASPQHLASAFASLMDRQLAPFKQVEKRLLQDYFSIVYGGGLAGASEARAGLFAADERMLKQVSAFLSVQKQAHSAQLAGFDEEMAAACLFGCVVTLISQYVLLDEWTYDRLIGAIYDQALFILTGHVAE